MTNWPAHIPTPTFGQHRPPIGAEVAWRDLFGTECRATVIGWPSEDPNLIHVRLGSTYYRLLSWKHLPCSVERELGEQR